MVYFEWKIEVNICIYFLKKKTALGYLVTLPEVTSSTQQLLKVKREIVLMQDFAVQLGFKKLTLSEGKDSLTI